MDKQKLASTLWSTADDLRGNVEAYTYKDYINAYSLSELDKQISEIVDFTGIDETKFRELMNLNLTENNINEYARFDSLTKTANIERITNNLSALKGEKVKQFRSKIYLNKILRKFLLEKPFSLNSYNEFNKDEI